MLSSGAVASTIAVGSRSACAVLTTGRVLCWGYNGNGQLGTGDTAQLNAPSTPVQFPDFYAPVAIAMGDAHACAVDAERLVVCWGWNGEGQLGLGDYTQRLAPQRVTQLN